MKTYTINGPARCAANFSNVTAKSADYRGYTLCKLGHRYWVIFEHGTRTRKQGSTRREVALAVDSILSQLQETKQ